MAQCRVLVADAAAGIRCIEAVLRDHLPFIGAETFDEAVRLLETVRPELIVLGYHFDGLRPYRLVRHVRSAGRQPPIVMVRALPFELGATREAEVRAAYQSLGVDDFISLHDEARRLGEKAAAARLRDAVLRRLHGQLRLS